MWAILVVWFCATVGGYLATLVATPLMQRSITVMLPTWVWMIRLLIHPVPAWHYAAQQQQQQQAVRPLHASKAWLACSSADH